LKTIPNDPERASTDDDQTLEVQRYVSMTNIANEFDEKKLNDIGDRVYRDYQTDKGSRSEWESRQDQYMELAAQVMKNKNYPWKNASNVKYPLLTIAALQFSARAYQALFPNKNIVRARVVGEDSTGEKFSKAKRIEKFMTYQLLEEMEGWEEDMDRLTLTLPILGNIFKKTYQSEDGPVSELVLPKDLVVNYYAKSLEQASRKTHILPLYGNEIETKIRTGEFLEHDYKAELAAQPSMDGRAVYVDEGIQGTTQPATDEDSPINYLEQHRFLDLDDDGYAEPYIVTINENTHNVVRIVANYEVESIQMNDKGEVTHITPNQYFTNFVFVPDPASGVYGLGLGLLLGPINEAANTLINQLIDAGTLSVMPSGFLAKGVRTKDGETRIGPGEWKHINTIADDLRKGVFPLPSKEPSTVLFQLLGLLLEAGQRLGTVSDLMAGESPGQNQPFSTTQEVLRQGMQVFSSIHKRIHRSLKKEFRKLYNLNKVHLTGEKYFVVIDVAQQGDAESNMVSETDFRGDDTDVIPGSDPIYSSQMERMARAQYYGALLPTGLINPQVAVRRMLEAQDEENIAELMELPPPQPSFEQQIELKRLELEQAQFELDKVRVTSEASKDKADSVLSLAKAMSEQGKAEMEQITMNFEMYMKKMEIAFQQQQNMFDMQMKKLELVQTAMQVKGENQKQSITDQKEKDRQSDRQSKAADKKARGSKA
jgi:chaperonin GroES